MRDYFLFNQYQNYSLLKQLWQFVAAPKITYLFAQTELDADKTTGPILVYGELSQLKTEYHNNPLQWPGLLINSNASPELLLKHLQTLLFATYPPDSKGILTYYDTRTLHYFLSHTPVEDQATYLGPIQRLTWYGANWLEQRTPTWQELTHQTGTINTVTLNPYYLLTAQQQQGLSLARQHKYIYDWSQKMALSIEQTNQYFNQALALGFDDIDYLNQYMQLRTTYPTKVIPANLANDPQQKINEIATLWTEHRE